MAFYVRALKHNHVTTLTSDTVCSNEALGLEEASRSLQVHIGRFLAQAISRLCPTAAAQIRCQAWSCRCSWRITWSEAVPHADFRRRLTTLCADTRSVVT
jgi:hypothetical protein